MNGINRTQIVRIDCAKCRGNGFIGEVACEACGGSGMLEKEVPFKFETQGVRTREEIADIFGVPVEQARDDGHSDGSN